MDKLRDALNVIIRFFRRLTFCAKIDLVIGFITGYFFGIIVLSGQFLDWLLVLEMGLILAIVCWVVILLVVGRWLRYGIRQIALLTFINSIITSIITVVVIFFLKPPYYFAWIGAIMGILVGTVFCKVCNFLIGLQTDKEETHA